MDVIYVGGMVALFAVTIGLVWAFERLRNKP